MPHPLKKATAELDLKTPLPGRRFGPINWRSPIVNHAPLPFVEVHGNKHVMAYVNSAFCLLLGCSPSELKGKQLAEIVPPGDECLRILDRVFQTGSPFAQTHQSDAELRPAYWLHAKWPTLNANEAPVGVIIQLSKSIDAHEVTAINEALLISGLHQHELTADAVQLNAQLQKEIKERKLAESALQTVNRQLADQTAELERLVKERTEKLRESVSDLEGFSYSVAHDMRTPLRGMQGFARILLDDYAGKLDAVACSYLERIASSATRMDLLIQDVLNYTHVLRSEALLESVDLDGLVRDIIATYPSWQPPKAVIEIEGKLPWVLGHEGFLTQCVSAILSNAIKFVAPGVTPQVRIWAENRTPSEIHAPRSSEIGKVAEGWVTDGPAVRIWFEDNGIGIAASDRCRVFRMFDRVNPAEQFEGTGMGLTIVRKAVRRLGGQIDFESASGKGSKFWMELKQARELSSSTLALR